MAVRDLKELGDNLINVASRLLANQNLCKLLKYTDKNPLSHEDFKNTKDLLHKRIIILPKVTPQDNLESTVALLFSGGEINSSNTEFEDIELLVYIYVPFETWIINNAQLRPFAIMSEIQNSLNGIQVKGLGKLLFEGFSLDLITDEMGAYKMTFNFTMFN